MLEFKLKSTCKRIKDIPWNETLMVSKILQDENTYNQNKEKVYGAYQNESDEFKSELLFNMSIRDTLFNLAMNKIVTCYEFNIDNEDLKVLTEMLKNTKTQFSTNENSLDELLKIIATKIIQKELIFADIASLYNIEVTTEEISVIINKFQQETGQSIDINEATSTWLGEKITTFIIDKFKRDFSELQRNLQLDQEARAKSTAQEVEKNKSTSDETEN